MSFLVKTDSTPFDLLKQKVIQVQYKAMLIHAKRAPQLHACQQVPHVTCLSKLLHDETPHRPSKFAFKGLRRSDLTCLFVSFHCYSLQACRGHLKGW